LSVRVILINIPCGLQTAIGKAPDRMTKSDAAFILGSHISFLQLRQPLCTSTDIRLRCRQSRFLAMATSSRRLTVGDVPARVANRVFDLARAAVAARGEFTVALSGGSLPKQLADGLDDADKLASAQTERWTVFLADERKVPLDHPDSNYRLIREVMPFLSPERIIPIDPSLAVADCAADYASKVAKGLSKSGGIFDLVLLGLGPDGHTASLFPGHAVLGENILDVAAIADSPKPPPERVTLTIPVINASRAVVFVCTGAGKADAIKDIFSNPQCSLPGAKIAPASGELDWFIDAAAAGSIP
jgi:6-phosphogluconolactonase